jgi:hypothetical protein
MTVYNVNQVSLRQALTPDQLLGRVNATNRFLVWGCAPLGALAGGLLGATLGLRPTLALAALGELVAVLWLVGPLSVHSSLFSVGCPASVPDPTELSRTEN